MEGKSACDFPSPRQSHRDLFPRALPGVPVNYRRQYVSCLSSAGSWVAADVHRRFARRHRPADNRAGIRGGELSRGDGRCECFRRDDGPSFGPPDRRKPHRPGTGPTPSGGARLLPARLWQRHRTAALPLTGDRWVRGAGLSGQRWRPEAPRRCTGVARRWRCRPGSRWRRRCGGRR